MSLLRHVDKAAAAWPDLPDWVAVLAAQCDQTSQQRVARTVGYSAATISYVIGNRYGGDLTRVEQAVRATLMAAEVICPELGTMALAQCMEWRERAKTFEPTSSLRRQMFGACRDCALNGG